MILGIDLGTSNTLASTLSGDYQPILIPDQSYRDSLITPSVVSIDTGRAMVGQMAESYSELNPQKNLIRYFKRHFGSGVPLYFDEKGNAWFSESIAALVLKKVKFDAEVFGVDNIEQLIVTVPSHYNDAQRRSVIEAAKLADMKLSAIIDEPVAAALSYNMRSKQNDELMLVYDFGGGTLDLTLITRESENVHVVAKDGIADLGGKEFDEVIARQMTKDYKRAFGVDIEWDMVATNKIRRLSEQIKIEISNKSDREYSKWVVLNGNAFEFTLEMSSVVKELQILIEQSDHAVNRCLRACGLSIENLDKVLLVGGTSQLPLIRDFWVKKLNGDSRKTECFDPLNAVALGASIYAQSLTQGQKKPINLKTVSSYNIFAKTSGTSGEEGWEILIAKNTPLPATGRFSVLHDFFSQRMLTIELGQSMDRNAKVILIGKALVGPLREPGIMTLELSVENRINGTLALKLFNPNRSTEIKFEFKRAMQDHQYNYEAQKKLVDSILINNIS